MSHETHTRPELTAFVGYSVISLGEITHTQVLGCAKALEISMLSPRETTTKALETRHQMEMMLTAHSRTKSERHHLPKIHATQKATTLNPNTDEVLHQCN